MFGWRNGETLNQIDARNPRYASAIHAVFDGLSDKPQNTRHFYSTPNKQLVMQDFVRARSAATEIGAPKTRENMIGICVGMLTQIGLREKEVATMEVMGLAASIPLFGRVALGFAPALSQTGPRGAHQITTEMLDEIGMNFARYNPGTYYFGIARLCADLTSTANLAKAS